MVQFQGIKPQPNP